MYYRVAIQVNPSPTWQWKSSLLSSLDALFQFLRLYRAFPQDRLRVFSSPSCEEMDEQLARENQGLQSTSVSATQFLQERRIAPQGVVRGASAGGARGNEETSEPPPSLPSPSHRPTRAAKAHWTSEGKRSNVGQVVIMTSHTGSRCQPRCHKSWPG